MFDIIDARCNHKAYRYMSEIFFLKPLQRVCKMFGKIFKRNPSLILLMPNVCEFAISEVTCSMEISVHNNFLQLSASI